MRMTAKMRSRTSERDREKIEIEKEVTYEMY